MHMPSEMDLVLALLNIWTAEEAVVSWYERAAERKPLNEVYPRIVAELAEENIFEGSSPYYDHCLGKRMLEFWKQAMAAAGDPYPERRGVSSGPRRAAGLERTLRS